MKKLLTALLLLGSLAGMAQSSWYQMFQPVFSKWDMQYGFVASDTAFLDGGFKLPDGTFVDGADDLGGGAGTDDQTLSLSGTQLSIEGANSVDFTGWDDNAADDFGGDYNDLTNRPYTSQLLTNVSQLASADTGKVAFVRQDLRGGVFHYAPNETATARDGVYFSSDNGGRWVRYFTGPVSPEWWGAKGDRVNDDSQAWDEMLDYMEMERPNNFEVTCAADANYLFQNGVITSLFTDLTIIGNNAQIIKGDKVFSTLSSPASKGQSEITVVDGSVFSPGDQIVVLESGSEYDTYHHSNKLNISSINGNTLTLNGTLDDGHISYAVSGFADGAEVIKIYNLFSISQDEGDYTVKLENLKFYGNSENNAVPETWNLQSTFGTSAFLKVHRCTFENIPNENISCNQSEIEQSVFKNLNGSCVHYGYDPAIFRQDRTAVFAHNDVNKVCLKDLGHNEGVVTWSNSVGDVLISHVNVDSSGTGFLGSIGSDDPGNLTVEYCEAQRTASIQTINDNLGTDSVKVTYEGNTFWHCGKLDFYGNPYTKIDLVRNEFMDGCEVELREGRDNEVYKNDFINLTSNVYLLNPENVTIDNNYFYNTALDLTGVKGFAKVIENDFYNEATNIPILSNGGGSFIRVRPSDANCNITIERNFIQDNHKDNDLFRGIAVDQFQFGTADIRDNRIYNVEDPIYLQPAADADTIRAAFIEDNICFSRVRTRNQAGGLNSYNVQMWIGRNTAWRNNYLYFDKYADRMLRFDQDYNTGKYLQFIGNTVFSLNNGGEIASTGASSWTGLGIYKDNIFNGTNRLPDTINITSEKHYTISRDNLNVQIKPNVELPQDFPER